MKYASKLFADAVGEFTKLPGIGEKTALRLVLHLLKQDAEKVNQAMDYVIDMNSDEYKDLEIEDISLTGQIIATRHLLSVVADTLGIELGEEE